MRAPSIGLTALAVAASVVFPVAGDTPTQAAAACGTFHARGFLSGFRPFVGSPFYAAREGNAATATVVVSPGCSDSAPGIESVVVHYVTDPGTAASVSDYVENDAQTGPLCNDVHAQCAAQGESPNGQENVALTMGAPGTEESAVEAFRFRLTGTTPSVTSPGYQDPFSVPVYVIDADGPTRASLEPGITYSRSETFSHILIPVFGAGTSPPGSVPYTLSPDPSAPATPGEDYQDLTGGSVQITNGVGYIDIGIVNDKVGEGPENVVITLGGTVDGPASTTFTIEDNEESVKPTSRFHHPRHKWRYKKSDYRIREFHVFTNDNPGGSGVVAAEIALRRNLKNGKCAWKVTKGWQTKDCQNREWLPTKYDDAGQLFYYRMKQLKPSVKTKIKNYTAFSRAIDGAENIEKDFIKKRNDNTFEIKKKKKKRRG